MVEDALQSAQYDIVHFGQHGSTGLLYFSDGPATLEWLVRRLHNQTKLKLLVLNACDSIDIGIASHNELGIPVICNRAPIDDTAAVRFSDELYGSISNGASINDAFREAKGTLKRLYPDWADIPVLINGSFVAEVTNAEVVAALCEVKTELTDVKKRISGLEESMNTRTQYVQTMLLAAVAVIGLLQLFIR